MSNEQPAVASKDKASICAASAGAIAFGALAVGATAIGALAIGALAIRRLAIQKSRIDSLFIRELTVEKLTVTELNIPQRPMETNTTLRENTDAPQAKSLGNLRGSVTNSEPLPGGTTEPSGVREPPRGISSPAPSPVKRSRKRQ